MNILWAGGEDIDFSYVGLPPTNNSSAGHFNANYARTSMEHGTGTGFGSATPFPGGGVATLWFSTYIYHADSSVNAYIIGLGNSSDTTAKKGLWLVCAAAVATRLTICKYDGTTLTVLATEAGNSLPTGGVLTKIDIQITAFADTVNGNVKVFIAGGSVPIIDYTGDLTVTGVATTLDVVIFRHQAPQLQFSEVIVADEDTRTLRLVTCYPSGAGTVLDFTGAYSNVDEVVLSDADLTYNDTTAKKAEFALSATPAGQFSVLAVMVSARACKSSGSSVSNLRLGVLSDGVEDKDAGQAVTTSWVTKQRLMATINGAQITTAVVDAMEVHLETLT